MPTPPSGARANPFVGPRSIPRGGALHGRDNELREIVRLLVSRRLLLLHAPSGGGKTSLLNAGVLPRMEEEGFEVWPIVRLNLDPRGFPDLPAGTNRFRFSALVSMDERLPSAERRPHGELAGLTVDAYLAARPRPDPGAPLLLVLDQVEEILAQHPHAADDKRAFFEDLAAALRRTDVFAVFGLRDDYVGGFAPYRELLPTGLATTYHLDLLGRDAARVAAEGIARGGGRTFPGAGRLVRDLSLVQVEQADGTTASVEGPFVEPVYLQVVCLRLWDAIPVDDDAIDEEDVARYADVAGALRGFYAGAVARAAGGDPGVERHVRDWVGRELIQGGARVPVRRGPERSGSLENVRVDALADAYLIRVEARAGARWAELAHDRLVAPIVADNAAWEEANLHPAQVQARLWDERGRDASLLLLQDAVDGALEWERENPGRLTEVERAFVRESAERRDRQRREQLRTRVFLVVAAFLVLVAAGLAGLAGLYGLRADLAAMVSRDLVRQTRALGVGEEDPTFAALLLREVESTSVDGEWVQAAVRTLGRPLALAVLPPRGAPVVEAAFVDGARQVIAMGEDGGAWIAPADGHGLSVEVARCPGRGLGVSATPSGEAALLLCVGESARYWRAGMTQAVEAPGGATAAAAWAPRGGLVALVGSDGIALWEVGADEVTPLDGSGPFTAGVAVADDGSVVARGAAGAALWPAGRTGPPVPLPGAGDGVVTVGITADGARILAGGADGRVRLWDRSGGASSEVSVALGEPVGAWFTADSTRLRYRTTAAVGEWVVGEGAAWSVPVPSTDADAVGDPAGVGAFALLPTEEGASLQLADAPGRVLASIGGPARATGWSADGQHLLTVAGNGSVRVWGLGPPALPVLLRGSAAAVDRLALDAAGRRLAASAPDGSVQVWSLDTREPPMALAGTGSPLRALAVTPEGVVTVDARGAVTWWGADGAPEVAPDVGGEVADVAFSADGTGVAVALVGRGVRALRHGPKGWSVEPDITEEGTAVAFAEEPESLWVADELGGVRCHLLEEEADPEPLVFPPVRFAGATGDRRVTSLVASSRYVAALHAGGAVTAWRRDTQEAAPLHEELGGVALGFLGRDDLWLAGREGAYVVQRLGMARDAAEARMLRVEREFPLRTPSCGTGGREGLPCVPELVAAAGDLGLAAATAGAAWVWVADDHDPARPWGLADLPGAGDRPEAVAISANGARVATGSADGTILVWVAGRQGALITALWSATPACLPAEIYAWELGFDPPDAMERRAACVARVGSGEHDGR